MSSQHLYRHDRPLGVLSAVIGALVWAVVLAAFIRLGGTLVLAGMAGMVVIVLVFSFLAYLFTRSALMAHLDGNGIEVNAQQLPTLHAALLSCCQVLGVQRPPRMYVLNGNGTLNAFATWFLGRSRVVLYSNVVDAMEGQAGGVEFYIGHELGHVLHHDNPLMAWLRWPALRLPLLGAARSRARESSCDLHGLACTPSPEVAARALVALAAGARQWRDVSFAALDAQLQAGGHFWNSLHELVASYPWTVKRCARVLGKPVPRRNPFAYLLAMLVPYSGRMPAGIGLLVYVYVIGVLAAIAVPAYKNYELRAQLATAEKVTAPIRLQLAGYYEANHAVPESLAAIGVPDALPGGLMLALDPQSMALSATIKGKGLVFEPTVESGQIHWSCHGATGTAAAALPPDCR